MPTTRARGALLANLGMTDAPLRGSPQRDDEDDSFDDSLETVIDVQRRPRKSKLVFRLLNTIERMESQIKFLQIRLTKLTKKQKSGISTSIVKSAIEDKSEITIPQTTASPRRPTVKTVGLSKPYELRDRKLLARSDVVATGAGVPVPCTERGEVRGKVMFLADDCGRGAANDLRRLLDTDFEVESILKPYATLESVVIDVERLCAVYGPDDHVVVCGGMNNILNNKRLNQECIVKLQHIALKTNLYYISVPYLPYSCNLNNFIYQHNLRMYNSLYNRANIIDVNSFICAKDKISSSPYFKRATVGQLMVSVSHCMVNRIKNNGCIRVNNVQKNLTHDPGTSNQLF